MHQAGWGSRGRVLQTAEVPSLPPHPQILDSWGRVRWPRSFPYSVLQREAYCALGAALPAPPGNREQLAGPRVPERPTVRRAGPRGETR